MANQAHCCALLAIFYPPPRAAASISADLRTACLIVGVDKSKDLTPHRPHLDILIAATRGKKARWVKVDGVHGLFVVPHNLHRFYTHVDKYDSPKQDIQNLSCSSNANTTAAVLLQTGSVGVTVAKFYAALLGDIEFLCDTSGGMPFAVWHRLLGTDEVYVL